MAFDFTAELPSGDVQLGKHSHIRVYGFNDISPPLVELRIVHRGRPEEILHLTVDQGEALAIALVAAGKKARGG